MIRHHTQKSELTSDCRTAHESNVAEFTYRLWG